MSNDTKPGPGSQMIVLLVVFLGGPVAAVSLSNGFAPNSDVAPIFSGLLAAVVFFGGMMLWLGLAVLSLLTRSGRARVRADQPPKGSSGFIWLSIVCGTVSALLTAIRAEQGAWPALMTMFAAFLAYGYLLHRLARAGYLPFVEDVG